MFDVSCEIHFSAGYRKQQGNFESGFFP